MSKQYASSVCSRKSATSAKSARSFLSLSIPIQFSRKDKETSSLASTASSSIVPQFIKKWTNSSKKKNDSDSVTTRSSTSSSINKLKQFIFFRKKSTPPAMDDSDTSSPRLSLEEGASSSSSSITNMSSFVRNSNQPTGILANRGEDSAEAIAERQKRRHQRRENILKLQRLKAQRFASDLKEPFESSSEDTLLTDDGLPTNIVQFSKSSDSGNDVWESHNPRIMFIDSSPVPRFRNVAPPPPSPSYLSILIDSPTKDNDLHSIIKSPASDESEPTVYATQELLQSKEEEKPPITGDKDLQKPTFLDIHDQRMSELVKVLRPRPPSKLRLDFFPPFTRGQTLKFSLQNTIPEDHVILFKFLTSNSNYNKGQPERYFIRPSAGKMNSTDQADIFLFLNHIPAEVLSAEAAGNILKDKIMIRWAVIQRNTQIEDWVNQLHESSRRKWVDMLDEEWPDQVTIRMTRIKIRFHIYSFIL